MDDVRAVMDAVGTDRPALVGHGHAGQVCMLVAASDPDRVQALVTVNSFARLTRAPGYRAGMPQSAQQAWIEAVRATWGTTDPLHLRVLAPDVADDEFATAWWRGSNVPPEPTTRGPQAAARLPAGRTRRAGGDRRPHPGCAVGRQPVRDPRPGPVPGRAWRELLEVHDSVARREIEAARGRMVKSTGDGLLATFDGPARAIRCLGAIEYGVATPGLHVRAGLHTGEIELLGEDVGGIAVAIAAPLRACLRSGTSSRSSRLDS